MEVLAFQLRATTGARVTTEEAIADEFAEDTAVMVTVCVAPMVDGAVYNPLEEIVPTRGLRDQVTLVFVVPVTIGVNC